MVMCGFSLNAKNAKKIAKNTQSTHAVNAENIFALLCACFATSAVNKIIEKRA
jgi:hypothetical protein